jgi:hypothetical protein
VASPLNSRKKTVDLAAPVVRVSRIRRDPPPKVKEVTAVEVKEREAWTVAIGIATFALALFAILFVVSDAAGWSPSQYTITIRQSS